MKIELRKIILLTAAAFVFPFFGSAAKFQPERYEEAKTQLLRTKPEDYKGKRIFIEATFKKFQTVFPGYLEKNGIKQSKYYILIMASRVIPVLVKKKGDLGDIAASLKPFARIKIYGVIKKFSRIPRRGRFLLYYMEPDYIEILSDDKKKLQTKEEFYKKKLEEIQRRKRKRADNDE